MLVGLLLVPTLGWADFQAGQDAYDRGDSVTALNEWRPLGEQRHVEAQFQLGRMYFEGLGVPHDFVLALMWANLAAAQGSEAAIEVRKVLGERLRDDQIAEAQRLAREWTPKAER